MRPLNIVAVRIPEAVADKGDGEVGNIDAYPAPFQRLRCGYRCSAPTERIQHDIAFVAARCDDALEQGFWLLRRIAQVAFA